MTDRVAELAGDASFVARLRSRDEEAFETLLRHYAGRSLRLARRFLQNEEDARDAVQDAFLSAFKSIDRYEATAKLSTWLHRIVVNCCLMKLRSKRRHPEEEIDHLLPKFEADGHHLPRQVEWPESADEMLQRAETCDLVRRCIDRLPDRYRNVLLLRDIEEMNTEEAAEALGVTPNTVKVRLHRARQALRTLLDESIRKETE